MLSQNFTVRFYETDALRHVSNTVLAGWFEAAREPVFRLFTPDMDLNNWPLILASYKIDFLKQIYFGHEVQVRTGIARIGKSSFDVHQEVWQQGQHCATGLTTLVHFDYNTQGSRPIEPEIREALERLMVTA
ncbi:thioesterase family protein [Aliiglaciecola sp. CAU 1673]|uniref:acyl-CoA thioesterase n=1 Tax=Aliiglaciecola sp. CAU 1673 TaxID=3032595 RepID=UPI0023DBFD02|nr:thioesterase family protein [Aliiglaciecola sp. CAU 1673]MDF2179151.1 thioesterase family protein [Aliiglaciecola sp. CAU 1673]